MNYTRLKKKKRGEKMNNISVLDCTLRDGGYVNKWDFGLENIKKIVNHLMDSNVEIIECGFLSNKVEEDPNNTRFNSVDSVRRVIVQKNEKTTYVCLMNYGEYSLDELPQNDGQSIDGLRVAFHKKDYKEAIEFCLGIKQKGYKVFVQPMVSLSYTDNEFLDLIQRANDINPYAFYIVDSFGVMKRKDLLRLYYLVEHNLKSNIHIGYHSHNNLQLAYSNAQALVEFKTKRNIIIDASIFGMGRGAGNLNTELFVEYLNDNGGSSYKIEPLLEVIDEVLNNIYLTNYWGYSLAHYMSAVHNCHPNYGSYLDDMKTLSVSNIDEILNMVEENKKNNFDKNYIESLYLKYQNQGIINESHMTELKAELEKKTIIIIAPGKSVEDEKDLIVRECGSEDVISIGINFDYVHYHTNYIFCSNIRRYKELHTNKRNKTIVTSNVPAENVYLKTKYASLLNKHETVKDNAGMMLVKFLIDLGVKEIKLAGFDGYSYDTSNNYAEQHMELITKRVLLSAMNSGMENLLQEFAKQIKISFITKQHYIKLDLTK
jgi:4-hydroxy 2-oxovalerate aldolase